MKKFKFLKRILVVTLAMIMCCGASISVLAAEKEEELPEGWRRLEI